MGASCSCSNCIGFPQDLDLEKEKKINKDFFLDYNDEDMTQDNKPIKIKNTPTNLTSNNNDLPLYTTKSYSNINNIIILIIILLICLFLGMNHTIK